MAANALVVHQPAALTVHRDADLYRLGALILSTLDRLGMPDQVFSRIVVYSQRVIVFDLPWLTDAQASQLIKYGQPGRRLAHRFSLHSVTLYRRAQGCALIIDIHPQITSGDLP
jgi:hypothetical protein